MDIKNCYTCKYCKLENLYETHLWCKKLKDVKFANEVHNCISYEPIEINKYNEVE